VRVLTCRAGVAVPHAALVCARVLIDGKLLQSKNVGALMRAWILLIGAAAVAGCAVPQYQSRLVPYSGAPPSVSAQQVMDICRGHANTAGAHAHSAAQAQLDARNNQVTGYNCNTSGQVQASGGGRATYSSNTNCAPTYPNNYGGKYGWAAALGDSLAVSGQGDAARENVFSTCAAQNGYRVERYCVSNCGTHAASAAPEPVVVTKGQFANTSLEALCRQSSNSFYSIESRTEAQRELTSRGHSCDTPLPKTTPANLPTALSGLDEQQICYWAAIPSSSAGQAALIEVQRRKIQCPGK
jgi:hypothetical protein